MSVVLITGGLSNFSNFLAKKLLENGEKVVILHNFNETYNQVLSSIKGHSNLEVLNIDNVNLDEISNTLNKHNVTRVIDCSLVNSSLAKLDPLTSASRLLLGVTNLLDAIRTYGKVENFTLVSGQLVYGNSALQDETQPLTPVTFSGASQMSVEAMVHSYAVSYRIPTIIGRIPNVLSTSTTSLESLLQSYPADEFVNILRIEEAVRGVVLLSNISSFSEENPADVFNISNEIEQNRNGATRPAIFTSTKISQKLGFAVESVENTESLQFENILPKFLIYGQTLEQLEFVKLLEQRGIPHFESSVDLETSGDVEVKTEISRILPSHVIYFSSNKDSYEGNCFTLRSNMSLNLYLPWLLASIADRTAIHFTYVGTTAIFGESSTKAAELDIPTYYETSSLAVKTHTDKMLRYFDNILQLRVGPSVSGSNHADNILQQVQGATELLDAETSLTVLEECLPVGLDLVLNKSTGIFNLVNPGTISFQEIGKIVGKHGSIMNNNSSKSQPLLAAKMSNSKIQIGTNIHQAIEQYAAKLFK